MVRQILMVLLVPVCMAGAVPEKAGPCSARVTLRNNSWLIRKFTIVSYPPGEQRNNTVQVLLGPGMRRSFQFAEGTRVYAATPRQTDVVMSGKPLNDTPLLVVACKDDGRVVSLVP